MTETGRTQASCVVVEQHTGVSMHAVGAYGTWVVSAHFEMAARAGCDCPELLTELLLHSCSKGDLRRWQQDPGQAGQVWHALGQGRRCLVCPRAAGGGQWRRTL